MQASGQLHVSVVLSSVNKPLVPRARRNVALQTTDAVGDGKLSAPVRNLTHFLSLGASVLLTAIRTYLDHYSLNCSKIIWINIPYSNNIFYSLSLQACDAHLANYTLYNTFLHNMICCNNTLFTKTNKIVNM